MRINGFLGVSLIDYPGKVSSIIYTSPCNFKCPFCHNGALVSENKDIIEREYIFAELSDRKNFIDAVTITGGEPTLHKGLLDFMEKVKNMGMLVKLDTNGSNPGMIKKAIEHGLVDYIAMDIKAGRENYNKAAGVKVDFKAITESVKLIMNSGKDYEFRTTVVPGLVDEKTIMEIGETVKNAENFALQQYENTNTLDPEYLKKEPYPVVKLEEFKNILEQFVKRVRIANAETAENKEAAIR